MTRRNNIRLQYSDKTVSAGMMKIGRGFLVQNCWSAERLLEMEGKKSDLNHDTP
jgi:hypothetical protein